jgi:cysteine/O-acetylserine efflux protein
MIIITHDRWCLDVQWVPFLVYVFVNSFTPGPNNLMALAYASKSGYRKTLGFILGIMTGTAVISLLCSYFNLLLFQSIPNLETGMRILGGLYMVYLALTMLKSKAKGEDQQKEKGKAFASGMLLQFMNPKTIIYAVTTLSTFILPVYHSSGSLIFFSLFLGFVGFLSSSTWALFGVILQNFIGKHEKGFNLLMGILLLYSAYSMMVT